MLKLFCVAYLFGARAALIYAAFDQYLQDEKPENRGIDG